LEAAGYTVGTWQFIKNRYIQSLCRGALCARFPQYNLTLAL
jgi:hypothetical protein